MDEMIIYLECYTCNKSTYKGDRPSIRIRKLLSDVPKEGVGYSILLYGTTCT
ncbi:MAG: hypothetical protein HXS48_24895 [Theionarchaea archaeon]|nr:hypothetical protein [Theionarchaea archaeon]